MVLFFTRSLEHILDLVTSIYRQNELLIKKAAKEDYI